MSCMHECSCFSPNGSLLFATTRLQGQLSTKEHSLLGEGGRGGRGEGWKIGIAGASQPGSCSDITILVIKNRAKK